MEFINDRIARMEKVASLNLKEIADIIQSIEDGYKKKVENINQYMKDIEVDHRIYEKDLEYDCSRVINKAIGFYVSPSYNGDCGRYTRESKPFQYWYNMRDEFYYYAFSSIEFLKDNTFKSTQTFEFEVVKAFKNGSTIYMCTASEMATLKKYIELIESLRERFDGKVNGY